MKQVSARVISNATLTLQPHRSGNRILSSFQLLWLSCPEIASEAHPGQFTMVRCGEECILSRPFSIHQLNNKNDIALFFAVWKGGKGTNWLSQCSIGNTVELLGPLGNGYSIKPSSNNILLLAGGVGIAPLCFLAQEAIRRECSVILIQGATKASRLYPNTLPTGLELVTLTDDGSSGKKGMVTDIIPEYVDWADQVFACGPTPMYRTMTKMRELKDKPVQISLEVRMGCGFGVCYGCTIKTKQGLKQVCKDGPVFDLESILWDELT
ncbi:MAG TPA: dihydroorotate dehydrogenase electron transfer subunit [Dehalococcoidia bacterium]|nr:dihydroorotate dehydrogenase electron transfer subunit [Dehalococcoidia bacterium]